MTGVLVVDDSSFARLSITKHLSNDADIQIIGYARDGIEALEKVRSLKPDVITLDIEMPRLNGLETLEKIMNDTPTPVVMLSGYTDEGSDTTLKALEIGAIDFFLKPSLTSPTGKFGLDDNLVKKIKSAATVGREKLVKKWKVQEYNPVKQVLPSVPVSSRTKVVVIGSSTGGPQTLSRIIPDIPADIPAAILVVQHMPEKFTKLVAERLDNISQIHVKEAEQGDSLYEGRVIIARGGYHMVVSKNGTIEINKMPPIKGVRPSVDVTMESVAKKYGTSAVGIVLTGMGSDGTEGASYIKKAGGKIFAQDEKTSVIYGMPCSVVESGYADKVIPVQNIAKEIDSICRIDS